MTQRDDLDLLLDQFFAEGPLAIADDVIEASIRTIARTSQDRASFWPRRNTTMSAVARVSVAAAAVVVLAMARIVVPGSQRAAGNLPPPTLASSAAIASMTPAPSLSDGRTDNASPTPQCGDLTNFVPTLLLTAGCPYSTTIMTPGLTILGDGATVVAQEGVRGLRFDTGVWGSGSSSVQIAVVDRVLESPCDVLAAASPTTIAAPSSPPAYVTWLTKQQKLTVTSPTPLTLGSLTGYVFLAPDPARRSAPDCTVASLSSSTTDDIFGNVEVGTSSRSLRVFVTSGSGRLILITNTRPPLDDQGVVDDLITSINFRP